MQKLQRLMEVDPAAFEMVMARLAAALKTTAADATGADAALLSKVSTSFADAAASRSLAGLAPSMGQKPQLTQLASYKQTDHRTGAASLRSFVSQALQQVELVLSPYE